uniref:Uncharacterized protein n=1 Tax=Escherichia coli TaxID=562 RepID=Q9FCW5_ECOLX|nr:hypothetical protein [Escherichia coli]
MLTDGDAEIPDMYCLRVPHASKIGRYVRIVVSVNIAL